MLRWGIPDWLACNMLDLVEPKNIDVYEMGEEYLYDIFGITPFPLAHNVPNCGYKVFFGDYYNPKRLLYATDTNSMDGIEAKGYDLYMIESNYSEFEITERILRKQESGEYCHEWDVLHNHLSHEKAMDFIYKNIGSNGKYVLLHKHKEVGSKCKNTED